MKLTTRIIRKLLPEQAVEIHDIIQKSAYTMATYVMKCPALDEGVDPVFDACYQMMYDAGCQIASAPIRECYEFDGSQDPHQFFGQKASDFSQMVIEYTLRDHSYDEILTDIVTQYLWDYAHGKEDTFYAYDPDY